MHAHNHEQNIHEIFLLEKKIKYSWLMQVHLFRQSKICLKSVTSTYFVYESMFARNHEQNIHEMFLLGKKIKYSRQVNFFKTVNKNTPKAKIF